MNIGVWQLWFLAWEKEHKEKLTRLSKNHIELEVFAWEITMKFPFY